jgi:hypothetical protein
MGRQTHTTSGADVTDVDEMIEKLDRFAKAYTTDIFPVVTDEERDWLRAERPGLQDRIAAAMGRHFSPYMDEAATILAELRAELELTQRAKTAGFAFWKNIASNFSHRARQERRKADARRIEVLSEVIQVLLKIPTHTGVVGAPGSIHNAIQFRNEAIEVVNRLRESGT